MAVQRPNPETDPFRPPDIPTEVFCLHCQREYESYLMEWHEEVVDGRREGFWCCPTAGCHGKGFGFEIFPIDPDYRNEDGEPIAFFVDDDEDDEDWDAADDEFWADPIDADLLLDEDGQGEGDAPDRRSAESEAPSSIDLDDERDDGLGRGRLSRDDDIPW